MQMLSQIVKQQQARTSAGEMMICRFAVDIDSDTYLEYKKDTAAIIHKVLDNIEKCSQIFEKEINTRLVVTQIRIFKDTEVDPYRNDNVSYSLLNILQSRDHGIQNWDKRLYLYTKPLYGYETGAANLAGAFMISQLEYVPSILHELGHGFGSPHTNSCYWPGGPIDYCASIEGNCYDKSLESNSNGTIMSACSGKKTFHPLSRALMRNHAESTLMKITAAPKAVILGGNMTIAKGDFYTWPASESANSYQFCFSKKSNFEGQTIQDSPYNGLYLHQMAHGSEYYVRVRSVNLSGISSWSNTIKIKIDPDQPDTPAPLAPEYGKRVAGFEPLTISFSPVSGATSYQVQIVTVEDVDFKYSLNLTISENQFTYNPERGAIKWRVKAIQGNKESKWSAISVFYANPKLNHVGLFMPIAPSLTDVPRTVPFLYYASYQADVRITVADNEKFTKPLFQKDYTAYAEISDVLKNLPANKAIYVNLKEHNSDRSVFPDAVIADYTFKFTTGSRSVPAGLTMMNELHPSAFAITLPKIVVSNENIWFAKPNHGYIKLNQENLTFNIYNRTNTDGLLGSGNDMSLHTDSKSDLHILNIGGYSAYRKIKLENEVPTSSSEVRQFYSSDYFQDFNPEYKLYWTQHEIYQDLGDRLHLLKQIPDDQFIYKVKVYDNKAWIILINYAPYSSEVMYMDLASPDNNQYFSSKTNPIFASFIYDIQIQGIGKIWLRQTDESTGQNSIAYLNGVTWTVFNQFNSPLGNQISSICLSPAGVPYVLTSDSELRIFKYSNSAWEKVGESLPYNYLYGELQIDKHENAWISTIYGLARLTTSSPPLPVTIVRFDAEKESGSILLNWKVADEINIAKYVAEHSNDGKTFYPISETTAMNNTFYSATHRNPANGINYYRLKSVETDDQYAYSKVIAVHFSNPSETAFFPNPAVNQLNVRITPDLIGHSGRIKVVATNGKEVISKRIAEMKETETVDLVNVPNGIYVIQVENNQGTTARTIRVNK
ncbi:T9SS type A sorting domain-containing protein [Dyadobacter sediminis]|nr:T9SS type A sorting domain-containing protein [Dyadobacter sediminis]